MIIQKRQPISRGSPQPWGYIHQRQSRPDRLDFYLFLLSIQQGYKYAVPILQPFNIYLLQWTLPKVIQYLPYETYTSKSMSGFIQSCHAVNYLPILKSSISRHALGVTKNISYLIQTQKNNGSFLGVCRQKGLYRLTHVYELRVQPCAGSMPKIITKRWLYLRLEIQM